MSDAERTQVLKFTLGDEDYCIDIDCVSEIVDGEGLTPIPESAPHVEGIMDLRGQTTTIVNPCSVLGTDSIDADSLIADGGIDQRRIVVLDPETVETEGTVGLIVSDVTEVMAVSEEALETESVGKTELIHGLIKEEDGFTLWVDPNELAA